MEREVTSSLSLGNEIIPEAAFIAWSTLETYTLTEKVAPIACDPEEGEKYSVAAFAAPHTLKNTKTKLINTKNFVLLRVLTRVFSCLVSSISTK